jgi:hypothetical protein
MNDKQHPNIIKDLSNIQNSIDLYKSVENNDFKSFSLLINKLNNFRNINNLLVLIIDKKNIDMLLLILSDRKTKLSTKSYALIFSAENGYLDIIIQILKNTTLKTNVENNKSIIRAYRRQKHTVVNYLWSNKIVKDTLFHDDNKLYNILLKQDTQKTIDKF